MKSFGCIAVSVAALIFAKSAVAEDAPTAQSIANAWKERANNIESIDVSWWSKRTDAADPDASASKNVNPTGIHPKPASAAIWRYHFVMDAKNRLFLEALGHEWIPEKGEFIPRRVVEVWDGKSYKAFYETGRYNHHVIIEDRPSIGKCSLDYYSRPIEVAFGPTLNRIELVRNTSNLALANETEPLHDSRVLIIGDNNYTFRVDPERDFVPLQCSTASDSLDVITQISYQPNDLVGWVPKSWSRTGFGHSESATVTQCTINGPIADSQFELDLSGGAVLQNNNTSPPTFSIIFPDGKKRELERSEWLKSFRELLKDENASE